MNPVSANININLTEFPKCPNCEKGFMVPFTDHMKDKDEIMFIKLWACTSCFHNIGLQSGKLVKQEINSNA